MKYRIKEHIDLHVLFDYGFKKEKDFYVREYKKPDLKIDYYTRTYIRIRNLPNYAYYKEIWDCADDQLGFTHTNYESVGVDKLIYDLIEAGLVEDTELKEGENNEDNNNSL